jgi:hypothetical protein
MKGIRALLVLALILCFVLLFASWLRTPHHLVSQWPTTMDRGHDQIDGLAGLASPHR